MTINQTLDKLEEHLAGIIPAFIMLGVVVFILLGLGSAVAPASAESHIILDKDFDFGDGGSDGSFDSSASGYIVRDTIVELTKPTSFNNYYSGVAHVWYHGSDDSWDLYYYFPGVYLNGVKCDEYTEENIFSYYLSSGQKYRQITFGLYQTVGMDVTKSDWISYLSCIEGYVSSLSASYPNSYVLCGPLQSQTSGVQIYVVPYEGEVSSYPHLTLTYSDDTDCYGLSLERNGEPIYLAIKGKVFGWLPVYTYVTVQDESLDVTLSDIPSRFFIFDIDYELDLYRRGSGLEDSDYKSFTCSWVRSDIITDNGIIIDSVVDVEEGGKIDIDPLVPNPPGMNDGGDGYGGYDTPGIEDIDHDGKHNSEDDDMDGDGIPNEEDDDPYTPGESGLLGNLGFTLGFTLPDIESIQLMVKNMKLPSSLKELFKIPLPDEYKSNIAVEETHVLYGYQQIYFGIGDGVIGFVMGIILVLAALIACIPRFLWEFFSDLIEWINVAFLNFYDLLVIPSEIFKLVIDLLPDELLALALLLFGVDLVFLFFRFVIPGMISGSVALGEEAAHAEAERIAEHERLEAEERIGDGHGVIFNKGGRGYRGSSVSVHRPSSSLRNRGEHEETSEIRTGHGWRPHRRH